MKTILTVLLCLPLQGCFFFYVKVPESQEGNACIANFLVPGDAVTIDETKKGTVKKIYGESYRCSGKHPVLADVEF